MMAAALIVAVALLAVLVAVAVPALLQLRRTLRAAENLLEETGPRLARTLDESARAAETLNRTARHVEGSTARIRDFFEATEGFAESVARAGDTIRDTGTMVGAVVSGIAAAARAVGGGGRREASATGARDGGDGTSAPEAREEVRDE